MYQHGCLAVWVMSHDRTEQLTLESQLGDSDFTSDGTISINAVGEGDISSLNDSKGIWTGSISQINMEGEIYFSGMTHTEKETKSRNNPVHLVLNPHTVEHKGQRRRNDS